MVKLPTRNDLGGLPRVGSQGVSRINAPLPSAPQVRPVTPNIQLPSNAAIPQTRMPDLASGIADAARLSSQAGESAARGIADFGKGLLQVEANIAKAQEEDDALDVIKAKAARDKGYFELGRALDDDPDYETFPERFQERASQIDNEALSIIRNPDLQEEWGVRFGAAQEQDRHRVLTTASKKKDAAQFLDLNTALETHRAVYLDPNSTDEQKQDAIESMQMGILASQRAGIISPEKAVSLQERFIKGTAKERAEILNEVDPKSLIEELDGAGPVRRMLRQSESSNDPTRVNRLGYAGLYQFGAPRLVGLGVYTPGKEESVAKGKWNGKKWTGEFNIPGFPEVKTLEDFLANPEAQEATFDLHEVKMDDEIEGQNLDQFIGQSVGGVNITREGLYAMLHLGGVKSTKVALTSDGETDPSDENGTSVLAYASKAGQANLLSALDPAERLKYKVKATQSVMYNDLLVAIGDGNAGPAQIERARSEGWLSDYDKIQKAYGAYEQYTKGNVLGRAVTSIADDGKVWDPTDAEDKKLLDALIEGGNGSERLFKRDDEYLANTVIPLVARSGIIPGEVKGTLNAMLRSSDPEAVVWGLSAMDELERVNPEAFSKDMGEDGVRKVLDYRNDLAFRTPEETIEKLRRSEDPTMTEARKSAEEQGRKLAAEVSDGTILDFFDPSIFVIGPDAPADPLSGGQLRQDFDRLYSQEYARSGDPNIAQENASKLLGTVWGQTEIGGERRLMRYPPEKYYAPIDESHDWLRVQAEEELKPLLSEGETYSLIADARTQSDIAAGAPPSYGVVVKDVNGVFSALPGMRLNFNPKPVIEQRRKEFEAAQAKAVMVRDLEDMMIEQQIVRDRFGIGVEVGAM